MNTLYNLNSNWEFVFNMLQDEDADEQMIFDTLESIEGEIEDKADNYAKIIKSFESISNGLKVEEERLNKRRKSYENRVLQLKKNLESVMLNTGKTKFKTNLFSFGIQNNPPSVEVENEMMIPKKYYIEQEPKLDKKAILEDLKNGIEVPGASKKQTESLRIR